MSAPIETSGNVVAFLAGLSANPGVAADIRIMARDAMCVVADLEQRLARTEVERNKVAGWHGIDLSELEEMDL